MIANLEMRGFLANHLGAKSARSAQCCVGWGTI